MRKSANQFLRYRNLFRYVENWWVHFQIKLGGRKTFYTVNGPNEISYKVPRQMYHLFKEIVLDDCYLRGLPKITNNNPVIIDIGANIGFFSLFLKSRFPNAKVLAYEPMPPNFDYLKQHVESNSHAEIHLHNKAVSAKPGILTLHYHLKRPWPTAASMVPQDDATKTIDVTCETLEQIISDNGLEHINLLKLDCEGAEFEIVYQTPSTCFDQIQRIALEYHPNDQPGCNAANLKAHLESLGYQTLTGGKTMMWAWKY